MSPIALKEQLESCVALIAIYIQEVGASFDPDVLQWPGGLFIATILWLCAIGTGAFRRRQRHGSIGG
jgi:hypothetical protein